MAINWERFNKTFDEIGTESFKTSFKNWLLILVVIHVSYNSFLLKEIGGWKLILYTLVSAFGTLLSLFFFAGIIITIFRFIKFLRRRYLQWKKNTK